MTFEEVVAEVGAAAAEELRAVTLAVYAKGSDLAAAAGIILADTKIEARLVTTTGGSCSATRLP